MTFLDLVQARSAHVAVIYLGGDWVRRYPLPASLNNPLWEQCALRRPSGGKWVIWQVDGHAHFDGISGDVDLDVMRAEPGRR
jgi:GH25 family lysozyme M1 (1,4-beta-N-acetylmuramidase)